MSDVETKKSFFTNLWERRFFQFFATYIAASWGAIQFLEWGVKRYSLPSEWVDKLVVLLLLLLPFVCSVIYFHGKAGDDKWHKFEKVFYPLNIIMALGMSLFLIDTSANNITQEIQITDVEGVVSVREVPKQEFNKRIVIFPVEGGGSEWKGVGISELLNNKLEQDMRVIVSSAMSVAESYEHYGYDKFSDIPFSTKTKIAIDDYSDFFIESKFIENSDNKVEVKVFETASGKEIAQTIIEDSDIYNLTEKISKEINKNIKVIQLEGNELYVDFPVSNMISPDTSVLRKYIEVSIAMSKNPSQIEALLGEINETVKLDPKCAECWSRLSLIKLLSGKDQGDEMTNALKYAESLPERQQLSIKHFNYLAKSDTDKATKLCIMWRKLYPLDSKPVTNLIRLYSSYLRDDEAKEVAKNAIEDGHKGAIYLTYANMLIKSKDWEEAEIYLEKYKRTYPKQFEATSLLVDTYAGKGEMDKALEMIEELIIMKPNENEYVLKKAQLYTLENRFDEATEILESAMETTEIPSEKIANYMQQISLSQRAWRFEEFGKVRRKLKKTFLENYPAIQYLQTEYSTIAYYVFIDQVDSIKYHLTDLVQKVSPSNRPLISSVNSFMMKLLMKDSTDIVESYELVKPMFESTGNRFITLMYESEIKYLQEDYEGAQEIYAESVKELPNIELLSSNYHKTHLQLEMYEEGLSVVEDILLQDPKHPHNNYYKSLYLSKLGRVKEAKETLSKVIDVFKNADKRSKEVNEVLELGKQLGI